MNEIVRSAAPLALSQHTISMEELVARAAAVQRAMQAVMKLDTHYGKVPGTDKPTLLQPGAEKLLQLFQLAPRLTVEDLGTGPDAYRYRVLTEVVHIPSGQVVGYGVGEASTDEEKYRWRRAVRPEEFAATPVHLRREKWYANNSEPALQVRTNPADVANTVLKMAKKRSIVDAAKSTCAASDIFEQDLEDLTEHALDRGEGKSRVTQPGARSAAAGGAGAGDPWEAIRAAWHTTGAVSEAQVRRLFALAGKNGWNHDTIKAELVANLQCPPEQLPNRKPYDLVVKLFEAYKPGQIPKPATAPPPADPPKDAEPAREREAGED